MDITVNWLKSPWPGAKNYLVVLGTANKIKEYTNRYNLVTEMSLAPAEAKEALGGDWQKFVDVYINNDLN